MSTSVKDYLERCHNDEGERKALHAAHGAGQGHGKDKNADKRQVLAPILAHARKLGFHFTEDELIRFVTGQG